MRVVLSLVLLLSVLGASLASAAPSFAEDAPSAAPAGDGHGSAEGHGSGEHDSGGNVLAIDLTVALATIVVFVLLLVILSKTAWKPILAGLNAREKGIRDAIEGAERANAQAKALLSEHERRIASAADEARKIVDEGRRDAEALKMRLHADAVEEAGRERERALRDIEIARQGAMKDIYDQVAVVATEVAGRIVEQRLDPAGHRRLVDEAVRSYEGSRKTPGARG